MGCGSLDICRALLLVLLMLPKVCLLVLKLASGWYHCLGSSISISMALSPGSDIFRSLWTRKEVVWYVFFPDLSYLEIEQDSAKR